MRVSAGPVSQIPRDRCIAVADGRAVAARVGDRVVAFENRCLHQESSLAGGMIRDSILVCPLHFWRYRLPDGIHVGGEGKLPTYPTEIVDDEVWIDLPPPRDKLSMRDMLLQHARDWSREP